MILLLLVLACGGSEPVPQPVAQPAAPDPLAGQTLVQICSDNGLTLIKWPFDTLQADFAGTCCGPGGLVDNPSCELDWPFSDVPPCAVYDAMRNHIYARYGFDFQDPAWATMFETQPWYVQRTDFDAAWLSDVAQANVARLKQLAADKVGCSG